MNSILITGGTGFIGRPLVQLLVASGYEVSVLTRNPVSAKARLPDPVRLIDNLDALPRDKAIPDVLVNLAGEPLAASRWTVRSKALFRASRIDFTDNIFSYFERRGVFPSRVISGSAIGYYGDCGDRLVDERESVGAGFAAQLCADWELSARQFESRGASLCVLRTGIVLGGDGGALGQMLPSFRLGLGGSLGDGKQYMSWIHITDMVRLILFLATHPAITGPVNAVSPQPVSNGDFSRTLAKVLRRPAFLGVPAFMLRFLFGEMAGSLLLASQRVLPTRALNNGFEFTYPQLEGTLANLLQP